MKRVLLALLNSSISEEKLIHGMLPEQLAVTCVLFIRGENIQPVRASDSRCAEVWTLGENADWYQVIGVLKGNLLKDVNAFEADLIIDAENANRDYVAELLNRINEESMKFGLTALTRILFLADVRSDYADQQRALLHWAIARESPSSWKCLYLMMAENAEQEALRWLLLPMVLQTQCPSDSRVIKAVGGDFRRLNIDALRDVPGDIALRTVCSLLRGRGGQDCDALLYMGKGKTQLKSQLEAAVPVRCPSGMDLLVHKDAPDSAVGSGELQARLFDDNPDCNPSIYRSATDEELEKLPLVRDAADKWEEYILGNVSFDNLETLVNLLHSDGPFGQELDSFKPGDVRPQKTVQITKKDGYTKEAAEKLESCAKEIGVWLSDTVFVARLQLIKRRIPGLQTKLQQLTQKKSAALEMALDGIKTTDKTLSKVPKWKAGLETEAFDKVKEIPLPSVWDDLGHWIAESKKKLSELMAAPDYDVAEKELADTANDIIREIGNGGCRYLIPNTLVVPEMNTSPQWTVYTRSGVTVPCIRTNEPIVACLTEKWLDFSNPNWEVVPVFNARITVPADSATSPGEGLNETRNEMPVDVVFDKAEENNENRELPDEYNGILRWTWRSHAWNSARVDIYLAKEYDNAVAKLKQDDVRPVISVTVDHQTGTDFTIGRDKELPSGAEIYIRVTYRDHGRDVTDEYEEFRYRVKKTKLIVTINHVTEGGFLGLLGGKPYVRLKIKNNGCFDPKHIAVAGKTGYLYTAEWQKVGNASNEWESELLPDDGQWHVVNRPGNPYEYEINTNKK